MDLGGHQAGHLWLALHVQGGPARSRQTWGLVVTGALAAPQRGAGAHHPETPGQGAHFEGTRRAHPGWRSGASSNPLALACTSLESSWPLHTKAHG